MRQSGHTGTRIVAILLCGIATAVGLGALGPFAVIPAAGLWWLASRWTRTPFGWVIGISVALHVGLALSGFQSNDLHRYLWEGTVQLHGFSPFANPPAAPALEALRDARFAKVGYPELPSLYPPFAQLSFVFAAAAGLAETGYRNGIIIASLALVGLIALWLRATGRPTGRALYYAWSPVAVLGAVGGHVDVFMAAALVGFVWAWESERFRTAGVLLGIGILAKTVAVLLVPWALWRRPRTVLATTLPVVVIGYAPYLPAGNVAGSLLAFASDFRFNATGYELLAAAFEGAAGLAAAALLAAWVGWCALRDRAPADMAVRVLGGLLLLAPVVHYWYATWLLALLPGVRSVPLRIGVLAWAASIVALAPLYLAIAEAAPLPPSTPLVAVELAVPLAALCVYFLREAAKPLAYSGGSTCVTEEASSPSFPH